MYFDNASHNFFAVRRPVLRPSTQPRNSVRDVLSVCVRLLFGCFVLNGDSRWPWRCFNEFWESPGVANVLPKEIDTALSVEFSAAEGFLEAFRPIRMIRSCWS